MSPYYSWPSKTSFFQNDIPQRIATRSSFRRKATEISTILPEELSHRQVVNLFPSPPWLASSFCTNQVPSTISGISGRDDPPAHKLAKSLEHICHIKLTTPSIPTVQQVQAQGMVGLQQLSLWAPLPNQLL